MTSQDYFKVVVSYITLPNTFKHLFMLFLCLFKRAWASWRNIPEYVVPTYGCSYYKCLGDNKAWNRVNGCGVSNRMNARLYFLRVFIPNRRITESGHLTTTLATYMFRWSGVCYCDYPSFSNSRLCQMSFPVFFCRQEKINKYAVKLH